MRIALLGGIFGKPASYRETVTGAPEMVLAAGLRARGHEVITFGQGLPAGDLSGFDVVHAHHLAYGTLDAAQQRNRGRFVFTSHWFDQHSYSRRLAQRYVLARADASVVLSRTEATWQRESFRGVTGKQHVIPNGVDSALFRHVPAPPAPRAAESWKLLFVGQLSRFKGVRYLLEALGALGGEIPLELQLAHHVDTERPALEAQAHRLGLRNVRFLGIQSPPQLAELYAKAHMLVLPSTGEAMPLVISEALMVGRPVVGTDVGAVKEQVADFGRVVAPHDSAALAGAIAEVSAGYDGFAQRAGEVSEQARMLYSIESMVAAHEQLYATIAGTPSLRGRGGELLDWSLRRISPVLRHLRSRSAGEEPQTAPASGDQQPGACQR